MNVLSLFDGISCGRLALERANLKVDGYYASEIEKSSIKIAKKNFPDTVEIGDIRNVYYKEGVLTTDNGKFEVGAIDMIIGGSPCTNFSSIGYSNGMVSGNAEITSLEEYLKLKDEGAKFEGQSYLFWEYIRLLHEVKPKLFLLENVVMAKKWEKIITDAVGVEPIKINSALVSAQNRPRLYWTNIAGVNSPEDKNIMLTDILKKDADGTDKSYCQTIRLCLPRLNKKYSYIPARFNAYNASEINDKACTLSRGSMVTSSCATLLFVPDENGVHTVKNHMLNGEYATKLSDGRYNIRKLDLTEMERLQTLPDGYTDGVGVSEQKRSEAIGNGWTVDVISHLFSFIN